MAIYTKEHAGSGITFFYIRYRLKDGRRRAERAGTTRRTAERLLRNRLDAIDAGTYVEPGTKAESLTFAEFADRFMRDHGGRCKSEHYMVRLRPEQGKKPAGYLRVHFGGRRMDGITRADLDQFARCARARSAPRR